MTHTMALLLLIARLGDVGSTYLATPRLKLEANPVVRKFKWTYAWLTVLAAFVPYYSIPLGIIILVASLLVCASNFSRLWLIRTMGEDEYFELVTQLAAKAHLASTLCFILAPAACFFTIGLLMLYFYPSATRDWGYYFAYGFLAFGAVVAIWGPLAFIRFRKAGMANQRLQPTRKMHD